METRPKSQLQVHDRIQNYTHQKPIAQKDISSINILRRKSLFQRIFCVCSVNFSEVMYSMCAYACGSHRGLRHELLAATWWPPRTFELPVAPRWPPGTSGDLAGAAKTAWCGHCNGYCQATTTLDCKYNSFSFYLFFNLGEPSSIFYSSKFYQTNFRLWTLHTTLFLNVAH